MNVNPFTKFEKDWALLTAGTEERYNSMTIGWGSLGTVWNKDVLTVYVRPDRYTWEFLRDNEYFTVSFFPEQFRSALSYLGSHSGRDGDKVAAAGLTPRKMGGGVTFEEAELTFLCRKLYQGPFEREGLADVIGQGIYKTWQPHWMFVGEILETEDRR